MKLLQFLQEQNGDFSSSRLFAFLVTLSVIVDYQHAIWTVGSWHPDLNVVAMLLGTIGAKVAQKFAENGETTKP